MSDANSLLISYAGVVRRIWDIKSVTLCLPSAGGEPAVIAHGQPTAAVPELADPETANRDLKALGDESRAPVAIFPSRDPNGSLVRVMHFLGSLSGVGGENRDASSASFVAVTFWLGLEPGKSGRGVDELGLSSGDGQAARLLAFGAELAWHCRRANAVLRDPVTALPGRADFQASLIRAVRRARRNSRTLALYLINPDDLIRINRRFGRPAGDTVIRDIAERLEDVTGHSECVHRYGGAVFAVTLDDAPPPVVSIIADRMLERLSSAAYLGGEARLGFCFGIAMLDAKAEGASRDLAHELVRRADSALGDAKRSGDGRIVVWGSQATPDESQSHDRLAGIFTADQSKDYRNMLLLWDTVRLVAESPDLGTLASRAVDRLSSAFEPEKVGLFAFRGDSVEVLAGTVRRGPEAQSDSALEIGPPEKELLERVRTQGKLQETRESSRGRLYATPLLASGSNLGALLISVGVDDPPLDASDLVFFDALAGQLAAALDRIHLAERERARQAEERERLEAEVAELREARRRARLVHRSPSMAALLDVVRRVAPTDVTVLVSGESGTGKEVVARTVHEMSPRRERQPIVVDCGAIAASLIDSELFGHERGAYTGADRRSLGRLAEADGGTLILDEIGELPLEVQSKLLRFVQEKQLTPVGATRPRSVDVRLIAVSHRNLAAEVAAGRFRGDLFHRLNVVHLHVPPLSDRPGDVQPLVDHFLERFARRYDKNLRGLTAEAEAQVRAYAWPGNVRELENRLLRAVILCEGQQIGVEELGLSLAMGQQPPPGSVPPGSPVASPGGLGFAQPLEAPTVPAYPSPSPFIAPPTPSPAAHGGPYQPPIPTSVPANPGGAFYPTATPAEGVIGGFAAPPTPTLPSAMPPSQPAAAPVPPQADPEAVWGGLRRELRRQVAEVGDFLPPLGSWLEEDLVLAADAASGGVASRGSSLLGMPETTYRRKVAHLQEAGAGHRQTAGRSAAWSQVVPHLGALLHLGFGGADLLGRLRTELLDEVAAVHPDDATAGAALMGVTPRTYRRWLQDRREALQQ